MCEHSKSEAGSRTRFDPMISRRSALLGAIALGAAAQTNAALASSGTANYSAAITRLVQLVGTQYQDAGLAGAAARSLNSKAQAGAYSRISEASALAEQLTTDLFAVTADKHLKVSAEAGPSSPSDPAHDGGFLRSINYGLMGFRQSQAEVAIVTINFFPELANSPFLPKMYAGLMSLVAPSRGLVIDLRGNMGGSPETVAYLMSYFLDGPPRKIVDVINRNKRPESYSTSAQVEGPRYGGERPMAVIVSHSTFSGGEAFAYHLRAQKRAIVVGEPTGGGANPGDSFRIDETFSVFIPTGRAVDVVTSTNWEGTGVQPDIIASGDEAVRAARKSVLEAALPLVKDAHDESELQFALTHV